VHQGTDPRGAPMRCSTRAADRDIRAMQRRWRDRQFDVGAEEGSFGRGDRDCAGSKAACVPRIVGARKSVTCASSCECHADQLCAQIRKKKRARRVHRDARLVAGRSVLEAEIDRVVEERTELNAAGNVRPVFPQSPGQAAPAN